MSRVQIIASAVIALGCFSTPLVTALAYGMALNNYIVLAVSGTVITFLLFFTGTRANLNECTCAAGGSFLVNVICASASVRYTKDRIMKWRWISLFLLAGQVNTVYLFVMPRLLTLKSSDALGGMGLTLIRIVVHPGIWEQCSSFQVCAEAYWARGQFETSLLPRMAYSILCSVRKILTFAVGGRRVCDCHELFVCLHLHLESDSCPRYRLLVAGITLWKESKRRHGNINGC